MRALANPSKELERLFQSLEDSNLEQVKPAPTVINNRTRAGHHRHGVVRDAVLQVLNEAGEPLTTKEIREHVEALLGSPISASAVKEVLRRQTEKAADDRRKP
jgi:hypothetical protein